MKDPRARALIALAAVAAVVVLFVVLAGGDDDNDKNTATTGTQATAPATAATGAAGAAGEQTKAPEPATESIVIVGGKPKSGVKKLEYQQGDRIQFTVESDVADEIHVHGYDLMKDVPAGGTVRFSFPAKIEGVFEVELEGRKQQIAELRVTPG
jgi:hypothetical protein